jgi:hypothetical protein
VDGSYAIGYGDLKGLKGGSKLMVLGTLTAVRVTEGDPAFANNETSYFTFKVERALGGPFAAKIGATITVAQIGGPNTTDNDDPPLTVGERAVLFPWTGDGAYYSILDGGVGHFAIAGGQVHQVRPWGIPAAGETTKAPGVDGVSEASFVAQVLAA